jgi:hydrogenase maturation protein HypF
MELEALAREALPEAAISEKPMTLTPDTSGVLRADWAPFFTFLAQELAVPDIPRGRRAQLALAFHSKLAATLLEVAICSRQSTVALSGGVFQNLLLLELVVSGLERAGLRVVWNEQVPINDGGIAVGQLEAAEGWRCV